MYQLWEYLLSHLGSSIIRQCHIIQYSSQRLGNRSIECDVKWRHYFYAHGFCVQMLSHCMVCVPYVGRPSLNEFHSTMNSKALSTMDYLYFKRSLAALTKSLKWDSLSTTAVLHYTIDHMNQENPLNPGTDTAEPIDLHVSIVNPERTLKSSFSQRKHTYHKLCGKLINKLHRYETPRLPLLGSPEVRGRSRRYVIEINISQEIPQGVVPQTFLNILHFAAVRRCTLYFHSR